MIYHADHFMKFGTFLVRRNLSAKWHKREEKDLAFLPSIEIFLVENLPPNLRPKNFEINFQTSFNFFEMILRCHY